MEKKGSPNRLINESSPYLLQHAHNPVDWFPWGPEALEKAKAEDKPILVSIGYAACHWCHVMERESFENPRVAEVMNEHFVCIKVDREERPDVDQIYMDAVQTMGIRGGWPLHVILNPEGKPFYGGTYFPPQQWGNLLLSIANAFRDHRDQLEESANQFTEALNRSELQKFGLGSPSTGEPEIAPLSETDFELLFQNFTKRFDRELGGLEPAPKFPMPVNYRFLLRFHANTGNREALGHTVHTLREMAYGGIYDQAGGGFARYSTDAAWLVPHFEKMLYDNGQLVSVYAEAYQVTRENLFREVVYETIDFVERELTSPEGGFYSSLDADSEGEEGKFYVFTQDELEQAFGADFPLVAAYYNTEGGEGNWEHGRNILHRRQSDEDFARNHDLPVEELRRKVRNWKESLLRIRDARIRPGLDDKILTSWNALMLHGLTDAYRAFGEEKFLHLALANAEFLQNAVCQGNRLCHSFKNGRASVAGFLEDYALLIRAYISLYEVTFEEKWLRQAKTLTEYTLSHFLDEQETLFFFTDREGEQLIARKKEIFDNVVPGSNSVMATNLHLLGLFFDEPRYLALSDAMLRQVSELVVKEPTHLANWATLYAMKLKPAAEIAIVGPEAQELRRQFGQHFLPNTILLGTTTDSALPLLTDRPPNNCTTIYVCYNKTCQLPVHSVAEALDQMAAQ